MRYKTTNQGSNLVMVVNLGKVLLYYKNMKREEHVEWDREVKRTSSVCLYCSGNRDAYEPCFLCKDHFRTWHERT